MRARTESDVVGMAIDDVVLVVVVVVVVGWEAPVVLVVPCFSSGWFLGCTAE